MKRGLERRAWSTRRLFAGPRGLERRRQGRPARTPTLERGRMVDLERMPGARAAAWRDRGTARGAGRRGRRVQLVGAKLEVDGFRGRVWYIRARVCVRARRVARARALEVRACGCAGLEVRARVPRARAGRATGRARGGRRSSASGRGVRRVRVCMRAGWLRRRCAPLCVPFRGLVGSRGTDGAVVRCGALCGAAVACCGVRARGAASPVSGRSGVR